MKLKLFLFSIFILLSLVGYKQYHDFSTFKSINSYESCVSAKGSILQESYPPTCVTSIGSRFTQSTPVPSKIPTLPAPTVSGWKKYTDYSVSHSSFNFEYPDFMPEPTIYWPNEITKRFISIYTWEVEAMKSGNYSHEIDLRVTGPYPETKGRELMGWIKEQGWPNQEGKIQEMAGTSSVSYQKIGASRSVESVFIETGEKYPRSWVLYFETINGIYRIDLNIQGDNTEIKKYQKIFPHVLSTFKFTD